MVKVLELKAELERLVCLRVKREARAQHKLWAETQECTKAAVRTDGTVVYLDADKTCRVVVPQ